MKAGVPGRYWKALESATVAPKKNKSRLSRFQKGGTFRNPLSSGKKTFVSDTVKKKGAESSLPFSEVSVRASSSRDVKTLSRSQSFYQDVAARSKIRVSHPKHVNHKPGPRRRTPVPTISERSSSTSGVYTD